MDAPLTLTHYFSIDSTPQHSYCSKVLGRLWNAIEWAWPHVLWHHLNLQSLSCGSVLCNMSTVQHEFKCYVVFVLFFVCFRKKNISAYSSSCLQILR